MELLEFIVQGKPLSARTRTKRKFRTIYDNQNNGLNEPDVYKFIRIYNKDVEWNYLYTGIIMKQARSCMLSLGSHVVLLYRNDNGDIEKYDSGDKAYAIQWTSNNCTLYAGITAVIRPLVKNMKAMMKILKLISDKPGTASCRRMAEISKHYFGRGIEYFNY